MFINLSTGRHAGNVEAHAKAISRNLVEAGGIRISVARYTGHNDTSMIKAYAEFRKMNKGDVRASASARTPTSVGSVSPRKTIAKGARAPPVVHSSRLLRSGVAVALPAKKPVTAPTTTEALTRVSAKEARTRANFASRAAKRAFTRAASAMQAVARMDNLLA